MSNTSFSNDSSSEESNSSLKDSTLVDICVEQPEILWALASSNHLAVHQLSLTSNFNPEPSNQPFSVLLENATPKLPNIEQEAAEAVILRTREALRKTIEKMNIQLTPEEQARENELAEASSSEFTAKVAAIRKIYLDQLLVLQRKRNAARARWRFMALRRDIDDD